ncbi:MAG: O-antigen ligase family protein [Phycisphaerae bacterium]|nr:O-antigen ligase family protein [Phycisphaerae bacterium]
MMAHTGKLSLGRAPPQALLIILMQFYAGLLRMVHETPVAGMQTIVFAAAVQVPLALAVPAVLDEDEDYRHLVRGLGIGAVAWLGAVLVQFGVNPSEMNPKGGGRFTGLSGGPQQLAVYLGPLSVVLLWLAVNETKARYKPAWVAAAGFAVIALLMSGSRTGMGLLILGSMFVLYARVGRAVLLLPIVGLFGYLALQLLEGLELTGSQRLVSGMDTRTAVWSVLLETALRNPIIGVGFYNVEANENSYLIAVAAYGVGMLALILIMMAIWVWMAFRLWTLRGWLTTPQRRLADLVIGYMVMYFAGAVFEWYIIARLDLNNLLAIVTGSMMVGLLRTARHRQAEADAESIRQHYGDESEWEGGAEDGADAAA